MIIASAGPTGDGLAALRIAQDQARAAHEANVVARASLATARRGVDAAWWGAGANFLLAVTAVVPLLLRYLFPADRPRLSIGYSIMSEGGPQAGSARLTNRSSVPLLLEHWEAVWVRRYRVFFWKVSGFIEGADPDEKPSVMRLADSRFFPLDFVTSSESVKERLAKKEAVALMLFLGGSRRPYVVGVWPDRVNQKRLLMLPDG